VDARGGIRGAFPLRLAYVLVSSAFLGEMALHRASLLTAAHACALCNALARALLRAVALSLRALNAALLERGCTIWCALTRCTLVATLGCLVFVVAQAMAFLAVLLLALLDAWCVALFGL